MWDKSTLSQTENILHPPIDFFLFEEANLTLASSETTLFHLYKNYLQ